MWQRHSHRQRFFILLALFLTAVALRTFRACQETIANPDLIRFIEQAQALGGGQNPLATLRWEVYHPLHASLALAVHGLVREFVADPRIAWLWAFRVVGILAGSIVALQIVRLARFFGAPFWAGAAASILWMVGRRTSVYGADGLSDLLALALFAESLLTALPAPRFSRANTPHGAAKSGNRYARFLLAGILSGLAYLARPEGVAAALIIALTLAIRVTCRQPGTRHSFKLLPRRRLPFTPAFLAVASLTAGFLLPAAPYMLAIHGFTGKKPLLADAPASIQPAPAHQIDLIAPATAPVRPAAPKQWSILPWSVEKIINELQETFSWAPWLVVLLPMPFRPQLWGRPRLRFLAVIWMILWLAVMFWLLARAGYLDGRHTLPLVLLLHVSFALALPRYLRPTQRWLESSRTCPPGRTWPNICVLAVFLFAITPGIVEMTHPPRADKFLLRQAAQWVRQNTADQVLVADDERLVGYYSGHPYARWNGLQKKAGTETDPLFPEIDALHRTHPGQPVLLGKFYPAADPPLPAIGPYQEVARFESPRHDRYLLYALPNDPWPKPQNP